MTKRLNGFTIVELLIVVVVIAILASITIVAFNGIQDRAREASVQSSASQAARLLGAKIVNSGVYPTAANFSNETGLVSDSNATYRYLVTTDNRQYCASVSVPSKPAISYATTSTNVTPTKAVCTTNLVTNPSFETGSTGWTWNTPGLTSGATGTASNPLNGGQAGSRTIRYTLSAGGAMNNFGPYATVTGLNATTEYSLAAWVRSNKALTYRIHAERRNSSNTLIGTIQSSPVTLTANTWARITVTTPVTASLDRIVFAIYGTGSSLVSTDFVEFDGAILSADSISVGYGDGSTSGWNWTGTANASTSFGPAEL